MGTIDGTNWSDVTIDGQAVQEITVDGSVAWSSFTLGKKYAESYISTTGGGITTVSGGGDITTQVNNSTTGDVILMKPGNYEYTSTNLEYTGSFANGSDILFVGDTDNANDVLLQKYHSARDSTVFPDTATTNRYAQLAFLRYRPDPQDAGTNYSNTLVHNTGSASTGAYANAVNVIIDWAHSNQLSSQYNNQSDSFNVRFERCTFATYTNWSNNYSVGPSDPIINDSIFEYGLNTGNIILSNYNTYVSLNNTFDYDTSLNSTRGHLYVPDTNAIF